MYITARSQPGIAGSIMKRVDANRPQRSLLIAVSALFLLTLLAGCNDEIGTEELPDDYGTLYQWDEMYLAGNTIWVFGTRARPERDMSIIVLFFPYGMNFDPQSASMDFSLLIHAGPRLRGGICSPHATYDRDGRVFTGFIAPDSAGSWRFEVGLNIVDAVYTSYLRFSIPEVEGEPVFVQGAGAIDTRKIYVWQSPRRPVVGLQTYQVSIYHAIQGGLFYTIDEECNPGIQVFYLADSSGSNGNTPPFHIEDGQYEGEINLDRTGLWSVQFLPNEEEQDRTIEFRFDVQPESSDNDT